MRSEQEQEQKRVEFVMETIAKEMNKLEEETGRRKNEVVQARKHFWDEVKVNTDTFDDYLETIIGLRQEAQALSVMQSTHKHASKRLSTLQRMQEIPYFGRIDLIEEGESRPEKIYIGIAALSDESGEDFLVYDWRAPVSSVYYDYQPGPVEYKTPGGQVHGVLEKKMQYIIRNGELQSMFDTSITIGDEILQQVLGKGTDKKMHSIVATIQQEQNRIIRHDQGRMLIVQGAAGSGKTSVALQRIAYLLYKYRDRINADQIILFSPNSMFSSYISNVLPELGEENMQQVTFQDYLKHRLSDQFQIENPFEQLEYVLTQSNSPTYQTRLASIRYKATTQFFDAIQSYRLSLEKSGMQFKDIIFRGKAIITAKQISERFYGHDTTLRFYNRLENLKDWIISKINEIQKIESHNEWVQDEIELLSNEEYQKARIYLAKKRGLTGASIADYDMNPESLARLIVHLKLKPLRKRVRAFHFIDFKGLYKQLFISPDQIKQWTEAELPAEWSEVCSETIAMLDEDRLNYEDATPFLLLKELIQGFQTNSAIKHIVVDEAQDYSPFQFEFLKRIFPMAKMTVLGDFNQAIFAHTSEKNDFKKLTNLYGPDQSELIQIKQSYRSTKPIVEFTRRLVPNGKEIIPFERDGERPVLNEVATVEQLHSEITAKVTEWRELGLNSIAIICKSAEESKHAFESLSHIKDIKLIKSNSSEYEQGIVIVPSYLSKGIEFDGVIIYDASKDVYGDESLRRVFYTVCTRAMHYLELFSVGSPSPFLQEVLQEGIVQL
ncbi:RNA polymerase recycling motor HelD [Ureibacillus acetophenoni]|uniref:Rep family ATP-dependent DNA helicase n=1 Tax=Ureibacillus acetophenoni TaxID=614649 RepID=A0A285ULF8_9BACL|nr:RNA polymerase recycling motor HelD [Ureibacillus acetophenoni]SOC42735.1 Rep family ATP-dependent DNA helicase [Ureibacillus acetophenoni]